MGKTEYKEEKLEDKKMEKTNISKEEKITKEENITKKEKNKKTIKIIIAIGILLLAILILSTIFALINMNNSKIINGVKIENIDVSGLTIDEAKSKIETAYNDKKEKNIILKYEDYETEMNAKSIETDFEIEKAVQEANSIGKDKNIFVNNYNILFTLIKKRNIELNITINEDIAKKTIECIEPNLNGIVEESEYYIEEDNLIITKGKEGIKIDVANLLEKIKNTLKRPNQDKEYLEIPVINKKPEIIDIDKIYNEIHKEVKDAYYTKEPFKIYTEVEGVDFNLEEAKNIIKSEDKDKYIIKLKITKPKVTMADIGSEAFPDVISKFTTRYDASNYDRTTNLRLACQKLDNKVILPGETFSYNKTLGKRTAATGYKNAKVYENGEVVDGIGGGICQISSTLYNAVLMANMEIVERRNHQFVTSYLPAGRDATVVYGLTDFRFKNTRTYAIKIKASVSNGIATILVYGIKEENEKTVSFETRTISTIPFSIKYIEDGSVPVGTENVKQKGTNGLITETYIIKTQNGKVVSRELLSKDTYSAMQRIIIRGTSTLVTNGQSNIKNPIVETPVVVPESDPIPVQEPTQPSEEKNKIENPKNESDSNIGE